MTLDHSLKQHKTFINLANCQQRLQIMMATMMWISLSMQILPAGTQPQQYCIAMRMGFLTEQMMFFLACLMA